MARKYKILAFVSLTTLILDQITKYWVVQKFYLGESIPVIEGFFNFTYVRNTGAAFGILAQADPAFRVPFFLVVPIIAMIAIAMIFRKVADTDLKMSLALSLVVGGAVGNFIDRIVYGYVVDFLDFHWKSTYHFPAFNIADSAICVGVGILMLDLIQNPQGDEEENATSKAASVHSKDRTHASHTH